MIKRKTTIIFTLIVLCSWQLTAQDNYYSSMRNSIGWHPVNLVFDNTIKIDYERRIKDTRSFWQVGLLYHGIFNNYAFYTEYYDIETFKSFTSGFDDYHKITGKGAYFNYKKFIFRDFVYYSVGAQYTKYNAKYHDTFLNSYIEDELKYYYYEDEQLICQEFDKIDLKVSFGIQTPLRRTFYVNPFLYAGMSFSYYDKDKRSYNNYGAMGYRGPILGAGFRIGWAFHRVNIPK